MANKKNIEKRIGELRNYLKALGNFVVAFSGGVDSTLLLYMAREVLGEEAVSITVSSMVLHDYDIERAKAETERAGVKHIVIQFSPLEIEGVRENKPDRCYQCKKILFGLIKEEAKGLGRDVVIEGTNADDLSDFRPGIRALSELGIRSPFLDLGIKKGEIREMSKEIGISGFDRPPTTCLLTRFPYNEEITTEKIERVRKSEVFLRELGFETFRVRSHGDLARIEVGAKDPPLFSDKYLSKKIVTGLKSAGFSYVTVDLDGYRTGSMNECLTKADGIPEIKSDKT
jgi:uncharacterized protein